MLWFSLVLLTCNLEKLLSDASLGFAAGVMTAASFWALLAPALEIAEIDYGHFGFLPVALGFTFGALFVHVSEKWFSKFSSFNDLVSV